MAHADRMQAVPAPAPMVRAPTPAPARAPPTAAPAPSPSTNVTATLNLNGVSNYSSSAVQSAVASILAPLGVRPSDISVGAAAPTGSGPAPPAFAIAPSTRRGLLASRARALLQVRWVKDGHFTWHRRPA